MRTINNRPTMTIFRISPLFLLTFLLSTPLLAQDRIAIGGMVAEAAIVSTSDRVFVAWQDEGEKELPEVQHPGAIYRVIDLPLDVIAADFGEDQFVGQLAAVGADGSIDWRIGYGKSKSSRPFGIAPDGAGGLLVAARAPKSTHELLVQRVSGEGKVLWSRRFDSLESATEVLYYPGVPYLSVLAWNSTPGLVELDDSTQQSQTIYRATTLRLAIADGSDVEIAGLPSRNDETILSNMRTQTNSIPQILDHFLWKLTTPDEPLILSLRQTADSVITMAMPVGEAMQGVHAQWSIFRNGYYAMAGLDGGTKEVVMSLTSYGGPDGEQIRIHRFPVADGITTVRFFFGDDRRLTTLIVAKGTLRVITFDEAHEIVADRTQTVFTRDDARVAAVTPSEVEGAWDVVYVTQKKVGTMRQIWWTRVGGS